MSDDWSLKGRKQYAPNIFGKEINTRGEQWVVFMKSDIDILREKLIEDLCGELLYSGNKPSMCDRIPQKSILDIINRRFGVE